MRINSGKGLFYGWVICGLCTMMLFVTMGTVSNGLTVFMPYMIKVYGISGTQASFLLTLRCVMAFCAMFFVGKYYDLIGFRRGTALACMIAASGFAVYGMSSQYWSFCIGAALTGVGYGLGSMIPASILMNRWFFRHRALAIGITTTGTSLPAFILPPLLTGIIETESLSVAFKFVAVYGFVFALIILAFMRAKPSDVGLEAYGREEVYEEQRLQSRSSDASITESFTLTRKMWFFFGGASLFMGAISNPGFVHLSVLYTTEGFRPMQVAMLISICGITMCVFKVLFGQFADMIGGYKASMIFAGILLAGHVLLCLAFVDSMLIAVLAMLVTGIGYPISTVAIPIWAGDMVSQDNYPDVVRKMQMTYAAGAMIFSNIPGIMADASGDYISAYMLFTFLMAMTMLFVMMAYREKNKERK